MKSSINVQKSHIRASMFYIRSRILSRRGVSSVESTSNSGSLGLFTVDTFSHLLRLDADMIYVKGRR